jgi:putative transcriptional regulator
MAHRPANARRRPRWKIPDADEIKRIRTGIGLSQEAFAERYGLNLDSLRKWEQNRATPEQTAVMVLRMVESSPSDVERILNDVRTRHGAYEAA